MNPPDPDCPKRGYVYLASVPFATKRASLQARGLEAGAEAGFVAEVQFKLRPVLVVQSETITLQAGYDYVLVAPIYSVKDKHRMRPGFDLLLNHRLPQVFYLDRRRQGVTQPSYVALAHIQLLHRSMLKEQRGSLTATEMAQIDERLRFCLGLA